MLDDDGTLLVDPVTVPEDALLDALYEWMVFVRLLDEQMMRLQRQGRVGFYGSCTGQEAAPIGVAAAVRNTDWIFPGLREGPIMLYRGYPVESYLCQVFGNSGDPQKGRQMPSHQADRDVRQVSWSSCIGTQIPHGVGGAWAAARLGAQDLGVVFFGDGATSTSDMHTGLHFAATHRAPCLLICQNNQWSISLPAHAQTRSRTLAERAAAYGLASGRVDGNDILAVYAATREAAAHVRGGGGSVLLEFVTYRVGAHSSADDPSLYRDAAEVETWTARDPIRRFEKYLARTARWDPARGEALRRGTSERIRAAIDRAEARPPVPIETMTQDVYFD